MTRYKIARAVMRMAARIAARIDNRPNVDFGCTITEHCPPGWVSIVPTGTRLVGIKRTIRGPFVGNWVHGNTFGDTGDGVRITP